MASQLLRECITTSVSSRPEDISSYFAAIFRFSWSMRFLISLSFPLAWEHEFA